MGGDRRHVGKLRWRNWHRLVALAVRRSRYCAPTAPHPGFDGRAIALAAGSDALQQLEVMVVMAANWYTIRHIHVSEQGHAGRVTERRPSQLLVVFLNYR